MHIKNKKGENSNRIFFLLYILIKYTTKYIYKYKAGK